MKAIVIFGATGDLCKRKLIPALYALHKKRLLPDDLVIIGSARREPTPENWRASLGDYPDDFMHRLDYQSSDLNVVETLKFGDYDDVTYFLSLIHISEPTRRS